MIKPIENSVTTYNLDRESRVELRRINRLAVQIERLQEAQIKTDNRTEALYEQLQTAVERSGLEVSRRVQLILDGRS